MHYPQKKLSITDLIGPNGKQDVESDNSLKTNEVKNTQQNFHRILSGPGETSPYAKYKNNQTMVFNTGDSERCIMNATLGVKFGILRKDWISFSPTI